MVFHVVYYATGAGRCQPQEFLDTLNDKDAALILADLMAFGEHGPAAPVSMKPIQGHRGLWEIRTRGFRSYYCVVARKAWVLHIGRKQDQGRDIRVAANRMKIIVEAQGKKGKKS